MKVIASNPNTSKLIVEVGLVELRQITGTGLNWDDYINKEFNVCGTWNMLRALQAGKDELPKIVNKLRALADLLQPIETEILPEEEEL